MTEYNMSVVMWLFKNRHENVIEHLQDRTEYNLSTKYTTV